MTFGPVWHRPWEDYINTAKDGKADSIERMNWAIAYESALADKVQAADRALSRALGQVRDRVRALRSAAQRVSPMGAALIEVQAQQMMVAYAIRSVY